MLFSCFSSWLLYWCITFCVLGLLYFNTSFSRLFFCASSEISTIDIYPIIYHVLSLFNVKAIMLFKLFHGASQDTGCSMLSSLALPDRWAPSAKLMATRPYIEMNASMPCVMPVDQLNIVLEFCFVVNKPFVKSSFLFFFLDQVCPHQSSYHFTRCRAYRTHLARCHTFGY